jgi:hypothetical protein
MCRRYVMILVLARITPTWNGKNWALVVVRMMMIPVSKVHMD